MSRGRIADGDDGGNVAEVAKALRSIVRLAESARDDVNETIFECLWAVDADAQEDWDRSVWGLHDKLAVIVDDARVALEQMEAGGAS